MPKTVTIRRKTKRYVAKGLLAVDTETTGLNSWKGDAPFSIATCNHLGKFLYAQWAVDPFTRQVDYGNLRIETFKGAANQIRSLLADPTLPKAYHNAKFDLQMLEAQGFEHAGEVEDTMIFARVVQSDLMNYALKPLCKKMCDVPDDDEKALKDAVKKARGMGRKLGWAVHEDVPADYWMPSEIAYRHPELLEDEDQVEEWKCLNRSYNELDTDRCMILWFFLQMLAADRKVESTYAREKVLLEVVMRMEKVGWNLIPDVLKKSIVEFRAEEMELWDKLQTIYRAHKLDDDPEELNPNSPKQMLPFLFERIKLKLPAGVTKQSSSQKVLEKIDHPVVMLLLRYRGVKKALGSFFLKFEELARMEDGCMILHPNFQQSGAATGRFSCKNPNVQNVPDPTKTRSVVKIMSRHVFGPRPGYAWYMYDFSGLEVRIFADLAAEKTLMKTIMDGEDPHAACANGAWGGRVNRAGRKMLIRTLTSMDSIALQVVMTEYGADNVDDLAEEMFEEFDYDIVAAEASLGFKNARGIAKMLLFLKLYGGGANSAASLMNVSKREAQGFLDDYDKAFPKIPQFMEMVIDLAREQGFIRNVYDRRISVERKFAYKAVNYMIQGSAADLIKEKMISTDKYCQHLSRKGYDWKLIGSIHDELVFEVKVGHDKSWAVRRVRDIMEDNEDHFGVFLEVHCDRTYTNWQDLETVKIGRAA